MANNMEQKINKYLHMKNINVLGKYGIVCITLLFVNFKLLGQIKIVGEKRDSLSSSVNALYQFLKIAPTNVHISEEKLHPSGSTFYDKVIESFFDKADMVKKLAEREIDIRIQYQILFDIDKTIDYIPTDSIFVMSASHFYENYSYEKVSYEEDLSKKYIAGYIIAGNYYPLLDICMNNKKQFVFIAPILHFDGKNGKIIESFIGRHQKNK